MLLSFVFGNTNISSLVVRWYFRIDIIFKFAQHKILFNLEWNKNRKIPLETSLQEKQQQTTTELLEESYLIARCDAVSDVIKIVKNIVG